MWGHCALVCGLNAITTTSTGNLGIVFLAVNAEWLNHSRMDQGLFCLICIFHFRGCIFYTVECLLKKQLNVYLKNNQNP